MNFLGHIFLSPDNDELLLGNFIADSVKGNPNKFYSGDIAEGIWFHRAIKFDDWLLYALDSPSASSGRGFCRGQIFNQQGDLVASVAQEGLIRKVELAEKNKS